MVVSSGSVSVPASRPAKRRKSGMSCRVFHGSVAIVEPLLHEVDAQHDGQFVGTAIVTGLGTDGVDHREQARPGNDDFHLSQKFLASGLLGFLDEVGGGKAELFHGEISISRDSVILKYGGLVQGFPSRRGLCALANGIFAENRLVFNH